jgi:uncharacterized membrane protein YhdT
MNNLALAAALATSPSTAFAELRERPRFWFPLVLVTVTTAAMAYWYYSTVDFEWLKDLMFSNNPKFQALPEAQRTATLSGFSRTMMSWGASVGTIIFIPVWYLLQSLYLLLAAKVTKLPQGFKQWFALSCWTALPLLLGTVVAAIMLLMSDNSQMSPSVLTALSLNELVFHAPWGSPAQGILDALSVPGFLSWALMIIGVHAWSQRSWAFSAILVLIPIVLIYGIWALVALR